MSYLLDVSNYEKKDVRNLQRALTFVHKNFFGPDLIIQAYLTQKNKILVPYCIGRKLDNFREIEPVKNNAEPWKFTGELRPDQVEIRNIALPILQSKGSISLFIQTGQGKSAMSTEFSSSLIGSVGGRVLVLMSRITLEQSWKETFERFTNGKVGVVPSNSSEFDYRSYNLLVCRISRIRPEFETEIDVLILDEIHLMETQLYLNQIMRIKPRYVIALTATEKKDNGMEKIGFAIAGGNKQQIVIRPNKEYQVFTIETGFGTHSLPDTDENDLPDDPDSTRVKLESLISELKERNDLIVEFLEALSITKFKAIVFADRKNQINYIYQQLKEKNIDVEYLCGTKNKMNNAKITICGIKKAGTGMDDAMISINWDGERFNLGVFIISTYKIEQAVGRLRVEIPHLVHLIDRDNKRWFRQTWLDNERFYRDHGGIIHRIGDNTWDEVRHHLLGLKI